jgi:hypothetical protein
VVRPKVHPQPLLAEGDPWPLAPPEEMLPPEELVSPEDVTPPDDVIPPAEIAPPVEVIPPDEVTDKTSGFTLVSAPAPESVAGATPESTPTPPTDWYARM